MKTQYEHIRFEYRARGSDESKKTWCCLDKRGWELGYITHYPEWNALVFIPKEYGIFSPSCLRDIAQFIDDLEMSQLA